jgi:predicted alpha/beta superfamily hydrolase
MKSKLLIFCFLAFNYLSAGTVKITITNLPANHPFDEDIYIAGDFNTWDPGNQSFKLLKNDNNTYTITLTGSGTIKFKFTRGNWAKVEKGTNCVELANRSFTYGTNENYTAQIINWADKCGGTHTAQTNVSILKDSFFMPQLNRYRRIWLYLPPDYNSSQKKYPVLYMHDGQNLFDSFYSFAGEWGIDESLNTLFSQGNSGCIAVGIDNGATQRLNEYSPWKNPSYGGGEGDLYSRFIVETLKPYIDSNFRTLPDRLNTGIMGSSMGGLISFYAGLKYQDIFSKIGIFSPSFWFSPECYTFAGQTLKKSDMKMFFLAGGQEAGVAQDCETIMSTLKSSGYNDEEMILREVASGQHSEWFWKQEFPVAYLWMFPSTVKTEEIKKNDIRVYPNPVNNLIYIEHENATSKEADIYNIYGNKIKTIELKKEYTEIKIKDIPAGLYYLMIKEKNGLLTTKFLKI